MLQEIITIPLSLPFRLGSVSCYLIKTETSYLLIDTGSSNQRAQLENEIVRAECQPGQLALIVITHGDFDHIGNAAYLRNRFQTKIAMHADDAGMAEHGDMFWNREKGNRLIRWMAPILFRLGSADRYRPDVTIEDGDDLSEYGFDAKIVGLPGHSSGSVGILLPGSAPAGGSGQALFCGDLLDNTGGPALNSIMDNVEAAQASLKKLSRFEINTIYPGHGTPFPMERVISKPGSNPG
jgi:glyoxylase-like metal-dependent hydrolase (beta-lactamase superfamily II)